MRQLQEAHLSASKARAVQALPSGHYWSPPPGPTLQGDEEGAISALEAWEGRLHLSSDGSCCEEEPLPPSDPTSRRLEARVREGVGRGGEVFADTSAEFCEVSLIRGRMDEWRVVHEESYNDAYIELCLPSLLEPLVRVELLKWDPMADGCIEEQPWYTDLMRRASDATDEGEMPSLLSVATAEASHKSPHITTHRPSMDATLTMQPREHNTTKCAKLPHYTTHCATLHPHAIRRTIHMHHSSHHTARFSS